MNTEPTTEQAGPSFVPPDCSARIECRSVLWGSAIWYGKKIALHNTLEEAINLTESITPPVSQKIQGGEINFYTIPRGEMVATVRCYIVPNNAISQPRAVKPLKDK